MAAGCQGRDGERQPSGAPTDPVEVCTRFGDVCRLDSARLGVCQHPSEWTRSACGGREPCFVCTPQH
jgi:hypothetical protein